VAVLSAEKVNPNNWSCGSSINSGRTEFLHTWRAQVLVIISDCLVTAQNQILAMHPNKPPSTIFRQSKKIDIMIWVN
jgi:hypothetical protein